MQLNRARAIDDSAADQTRLLDLIAMAFVFGLAAGLVEGAELLALQFFDAANFPVLVPTEILSVSPALSTVLYAMLAVTLAGLRRFLPRLPLEVIAVGLLSFMAFLDWLVVSRYIADFPGAFFLAIGFASVFTRWFRRHRSAGLAFCRKTAPWAVATVLLLVVLFPVTEWAQERILTARLPAAKPGLPNIVVVIIDTLRADHMSVYGYRRKTTPNLERLARQGVLFENAFSTSSWTLPAHASMLTGRYPHEHGAESVSYDGRYTTLPQELTRLGYRTGAFSANLGYFTERRGFGQGFLHFEDLFQTAGDKLFRTFYGREFVDITEDEQGPEDIPQRRHASDINRAATRWIRREPGRPFFAMLNYFDTHDPYLPPAPYGTKFSNGRKPAGLINHPLGRFHPQLSPEQLRGEIDAYDAAVSYVDDQFGDLFAQLAAAGYGQNTLFVVVSDHGEALGEHGLLGHGNVLYPEVTHVPLLLWWPGHVPADARIATPVSISELPATVMELSGNGRQKLFLSPSLAELWEVPATQAHWPSPLAELAQQTGDKQNPAYLGWSKCLITPEWYYIAHQNLPPELYAWTTDPGATRNLAATAQGAEVARGLESDLEAILRGSKVARLPDPGH